jgi:hypothetical protein
MQSILTVITPADSQDLTILSTVKAELGLTDNSQDAAIETWIDQASGIVSSYCNRVFGRETVTETFRTGRYELHDRCNIHSVVLTRSPVTTITSLVLTSPSDEAVTLVQDTDFELDPPTGVLYRIKNDRESTWKFRKLVVTYTAGYELLGTLPVNVERACITMVKLLRANATRDPSLKSENLLSGLYSYTLNSARDWPVGIPADVQALLDPYRSVSV